MAKELVLEQVLGNRPAVEADERTRALAVRVKIARGDLLARAGLAGEENGGRHIGHEIELLHDLAEGGALADEDRPLDLLALDRARERTLDSILEDAGLEGFREKIVGAELHRLDRVPDSSTPR